MSLASPTIVVTLEHVASTGSVFKIVRWISSWMKPMISQKICVPPTSRMWSGLGRLARRDLKNSKRFLRKLMAMEAGHGRVVTEVEFACTLLIMRMKILLLTFFTGAHLSAPDWDSILRSQKFVS